MKAQIQPYNKIKSIKFYQKYYSRITHYSLDTQEKVYLGDKNNRVCRFCGRSETNGANFKQTAHALPESIGNKTLISYYECDECNKEFGNKIENEYANYMNINHTVSGIRGKKKIPLYENNNSKMK